MKNARESKPRPMTGYVATPMSRGRHEARVENMRTRYEIPSTDRVTIAAGSDSTHTLDREILSAFNTNRYGR